MSLATAEAVYFARCGGRGSSTQRPIWPRINAPGEEIQAANLPRASARKGPSAGLFPFDRVLGFRSTARPARDGLSTVGCDSRRPRGHLVGLTAG